VHSSGHEAASDSVRAQLANELAGVLKRRPVKTFRDPASHDLQQFKVLAEVASTLEPDIWNRDPPAALLAVLRRAVAELPDQAPKQHCQTTWRSIGTTLFGLRSDMASGAAQPSNTYNSVLDQAKLEAGLYVSESTFKRTITRPLRLQLAQILLKLHLRVQTASAREKPDDLVVERIEPEWIIRSDELARIRHHIQSDKRIICIWGEPGTGKSVLASHIAEGCGLNPYKVITLRAAESASLHYDVVEALSELGLKPENWSDTYCQVVFKKMIATLPTCHLLVIDDLAVETDLWKVVPTEPKVPVVVTMRNQPSHLAIVSEELHDFTELQARDFMRLRLQSYQEVEAMRLARTLGYRPLALDHAVLFLNDCPDIEPLDLTRKLVEDISEGLEIVASPADRDRSLTRLYQVILSSVVEIDAAKEVLDSVIGISGKTAEADLEAVFYYMNNKPSEPRERFFFRSGLRVLARRGLLRESKTVNSTGNVTRTLSMHQLTYELMRSFRGIIPFTIETEWYDLLLREETGYLHPGFSKGLIRAWLIRCEMLAVREFLPGGWLYISCIDKLTWLVVREERGGAVDEDKSYTLRYEITELGLYVLDYRTGVRVSINDYDTEEEVENFFDMVEKYTTVVVPKLRYLRDMKEGDILNRHSFD
jgi:adenylate kinase family enzyme